MCDSRSSRTIIANERFQAQPALFGFHTDDGTRTRPISPASLLKLHDAAEQREKEQRQANANAVAKLFQDSVGAATKPVLKHDPAIQQRHKELEDARLHAAGVARLHRQIRFMAAREDLVTSKVLTLGRCLAPRATSTRELLYKQYNGREAVYSSPEEASKALGGEYNAFLDSLTNMFTITGKDSEYHMTGTEFTDRVIRAIMTELLAGAQIYVYSCDFQPNVPVEKRDEQRDRTDRASVEPYPEGSVLCPDGIKEAPETDEPGCMFDTRRLMATRSLRVSFCELLIEELRKREDIPDGRLIVIQYQGSGVHLIGPNKAYRFSTDYQHHHGEGEMAVLFWMQLLHSRPLKLISTDTDEIVACMAILHDETALKPKTIVWQYRDTTKARVHDTAHVDMTKLTKNVLEASQMTTAQWCAVWCIGGCDYLKKDVVAHFISLQDIVDAVQACKIPFTKKENTSALMWILRYMYSPKCKSNKRKSPETDDNHNGPGVELRPYYDIAISLAGSKRYRFPNETKILHANTRICFAIAYWTKMYRLADPVARRIPELKFEIEAAPKSELDTGVLCQWCIKNGIKFPLAECAQCPSCSRAYCLKTGPCKEVFSLSQNGGCVECDPTPLGLEAFTMREK